MPITMGIIMAATPVLERNPERSAVTRLTAKTCFRSLLANLMANVAMSWASPVAKMAWPITRKAPIKITFELEKPATASDADRHPHRQRASVVHMAVRARGDLLCHHQDDGDDHDDKRCDHGIHMVSPLKL